MVKGILCYNYIINIYCYPIGILHFVQGEKYCEERVPVTSAAFADTKNHGGLYGGHAACLLSRNESVFKRAAENARSD